MPSSQCSRPYLGPTRKELLGLGAIGAHSNPVMGESCMTI